MLADDVLADQVRCGPPVGVVLRVVAGRPEADGGQVVGQRVEPDVGDVLVVPGQRDATLE